METTHNTANYGGVNVNSGNITINNVIYTNNTATRWGRVNYNSENGNLNITNATFTNNNAALWGGVNFNTDGNNQQLNIHKQHSINLWRDNLQFKQC